MEETKAEKWINERQELYQWFSKHTDMPSLSPMQGIAMVKVLDAVKEAYEAEQDEKIRVILFAYMVSLRVVTDTAAVQQKAVIDKFARLIKVSPDEG